MNDEATDANLIERDFAAVEREATAAPGIFVATGRVSLGQLMSEIATLTGATGIGVELPGNEP